MTGDYVVLAEIVYDLQDAQAELSEVLELFTPNEKVNEEEFKSRMAHLFAHLNSAWNKRTFTAEELRSADGAHLNLLKEFPKDLKPN